MYSNSALQILTINLLFKAAFFNFKRLEVANNKTFLSVQSLTSISQAYTFVYYNNEQDLAFLKIAINLVYTSNSNLTLFKKFDYLTIQITLISYNTARRDTKLISFGKYAKKDLSKWVLDSTNKILVATQTYEYYSKFEVLLLIIPIKL